MAQASTIAFFTFAYLALFVAWRLAHGPAIQPVEYTFNPELYDLEPNDLLVDAEHYFEGQITGPESFVGRDGYLYTGLNDGRIIRFKHEDPSSFELFARTGADLPGCGSYDFEPICGRPLSMKFDSAGSLIVVDAYKGLLSIDQRGNVKPLLTFAEGRSLLVPNALEIAPDGKMYLTDSSSRFTRRDVYLDALEGRPTGRLIMYDPKTEEAKVLLDGLRFPNGVALSHGGDELLFALGNARVHAYNLTDGSVRTVLSNVPGVTDNISRHPDRPTYFVATCQRQSKPFAPLHFCSKFLTFRWLVAKLFSMEFLASWFPRYGLIVEFSDDGRILRTLQDPTGRTAWLSELHVEGKYFWLGSFRNTFVARTLKK
eukprot:NODE_1232_length_1625_cov_10.479061_g1097_i0.p1 GENE.NODE_1232_length_1625_cov_10.479061_g1097_i0~~NODE_1232_length_1625_cov_10.479061_g1097_i0.p1  ORF type:complete len:371 (-),score=43.81 NODE_1232_length_1625_cov_10.479061_g1097_i0:474-1586(-)